MSGEHENQLIKEFLKLKSEYLNLKNENEILVEKILYLKERLECKENLRSKLMKLCSEKISKNNSVIEHLQDVIKNQNEQIIEQDKTIERLQKTSNIQTINIKHPCFESKKLKEKKERKPQVRFPLLNLTISKKTNESQELNRRRLRKLYQSDEETVDLSSTPS